MLRYLLICWMLCSGPAQAAAGKRPTLLYFTAPWCSWCLQFDRQVLEQEKTRAFLRACCKLQRIDADRHHGRFRALGGRGLPYLVLQEPNGKPLARMTGLLHTEDFLAWLEQALEAAAGSRIQTTRAIAAHTLLEWLWDAWDEQQHHFTRPTLHGLLHTKHPQPLTLALLLRLCSPATEQTACPEPRWRKRLRHGLDHMLQQLEATGEGGFHHYHDPYTGHVEKARRLRHNARMLLLLAEACHRLETDRYCQAMLRTRAFLLGLHRPPRWLAGADDAQPATVADTAQALLALMASRPPHQQGEIDTILQDSLCRAGNRLKQETASQEQRLLDLAWYTYALQKAGLGHSPCPHPAENWIEEIREKFLQPDGSYRTADTRADPEINGLMAMICSQRQNCPLPVQAQPGQHLEIATETQPDDLALLLQAHLLRTRGENPTP